MTLSLLQFTQIKLVPSLWSLPITLTSALNQSQIKWINQVFPSKMYLHIGIYKYMHIVNKIVHIE